MTGHGKTAASEPVYPWDTAGQFKYAATALTMEVMVVGFTGALIDWRSTGKIHRGQPSGVEQGFDIAVDGCDPQTLHAALGGLQNLLRRERSASVLEGFAYRLPLPGIAIAGHLPLK
jgi:hypothetical protein